MVPVRTPSTDAGHEIGVWKWYPPTFHPNNLSCFFVRFFMILTWDMPHFWTNPFIFLVFLGSHHSPFFGSQFLGHGQCSNPLPNMVLYACAISAWSCPHDRTSPGKKSLETSRRDETRLGRIHIIFLRDDPYLTKINGAWEYVWTMLVRAEFFDFSSYWTNQNMGIQPARILRMDML